MKVDQNLAFVKSEGLWWTTFIHHSFCGLYLKIICSMIPQTIKKSFENSIIYLINMPCYVTVTKHMSSHFPLTLNEKQYCNKETIFLSSATLSTFFLFLCLAIFFYFQSFWWDFFSLTCTYLFEKLRTLLQLFHALLLKNQSFGCSLSYQNIMKLKWLVHRC